MSATAVDGHGELVEQLDLLVREAVRRQGVDPQRDAPSSAASPRASSATTTSAASPARRRRFPTRRRSSGELVARVSGFGPLQPFLDDPRSRRSGSTTRRGCSSPGTGATS
jgi:pilus assembly protein CpaF